MTHDSLAFPLLVTCAIAVVTTAAHRRLPPALAARLVTIAVLVVAVTAMPTVLLVSLAFLAHVPIVGPGFEWCAQAFGLHASISPWVGVPAVTLVIAGAVRARRLLRERSVLGRLSERSQQWHHSQVRGVAVVPGRRPFAVTLPGGAGRIVLSQALVDLLDDDERAVVIAHERAHARFRHDRYVFVAELVAAALPPARALSRRVVFSVERWADEAAARACGDRHLVAVTLGKVAAASSPPPGQRLAIGFTGLGVAARMHSLLTPPVERPRGGLVVALWSSLLVAAAFGAYQIHHLERLTAALCPH